MKHLILFVALLAVVAASAPAAALRDASRPSLRSVETAVYLPLLRQSCTLNAPHVDDLEPEIDGSLFFYVYVELGNDSNHQLGFEHDGDRWEFAEFYSWGEAAECQQQLDVFVDFTMGTLTNIRDCDPVIYGENVAHLNGRLLPPYDWYVEMLTQFCRHPYSPPSS